MEILKNYYNFYTWNKKLKINNIYNFGYKPN